MGITVLPYPLWSLRMRKYLYFWIPTVNPFYGHSGKMQLLLISVFETRIIQSWFKMKYFP